MLCHLSRLDLAFTVPVAYTSFYSASFIAIQSQRMLVLMSAET